MYHLACAIKVHETLEEVSNTDTLQVCFFALKVETNLEKVLYFTQARVLENTFYTEERVNYDKQISRQNSVNRDLLGQANYKDQDYAKFVKIHTVCETTH